MAKIKINAKEAVKGIKTFLKRDEVAGQIIAGIPKFGLSMFLSELGNKALMTGAGIIGNIANENLNKGKKKALLRSFFTNLMMSFADPTANQLREIKRNVADLKAGIAGRNFSSAFGALIEEPSEVVGAIRSMIPQFSGFKMPKLFGRTMGIAKNIGTTPAIKQITPRIATRYSSALDERDLVTY